MRCEGPPASAYAATPAPSEVGGTEAAARMRFATPAATRWLIAGLSARDTVEGCTPHFSATSLMVGRGEACLTARPATLLSFRTIGGVFRGRAKARQRAWQACPRILDRHP